MLGIHTWRVQQQAENFVMQDNSSVTCAHKTGWEHPTGQAQILPSKVLLPCAQEYSEHEHALEI